ncbi:MAG: hypothetical protein FWG88_06995 [Oscillospiraceae bacterium]|nr:hypothetical protein [Oscillospiraceae bacterium]
MEDKMLKTVVEKYFSLPKEAQNEIMEFLSLLESQAAKVSEMSEESEIYDRELN